MNREDYDKCARRIAMYGQRIFDKMAEGEISSARYTRLNTKLNEWGAELERRKPRRRAAN
ncbi:hypothetical protein [Paenibacillus sp. YIM B09110]|uniref:hypothetical protein n=1 Tax=Paenibacillus sp. YIM B09110 TaxID=3126102 RepID=UPI00301BB53F